MEEFSVHPLTDVMSSTQALINLSAFIVQDAEGTSAVVTYVIVPLGLGKEVSMILRASHNILTPALTLSSPLETPVPVPIIPHLQTM